MYPSGHARNTEADLQKILDHKNVLLGDLVFTDSGVRSTFVEQLKGMKGASDVRDFYNFDWNAMVKHDPIDGVATSSNATSSSATSANAKRVSNHC